jgi:hypothetical protein
VVWAKFESFPFWPAVVSEFHGNSDIDVETRKELNEQAGGTNTKSSGKAGAGSKKKAGGANGKELVRAVHCASQPPLSPLRTASCCARIVGRV